MADQALMSLEKARATLWPFGELKGRCIGDLIDSGQIGTKDLGYAYDHAYHAHLRQAVATILLDRLNNAPKESTEVSSHLRVYSSGLRSFSERRQLFLMAIGGVLFGFVIVFIVSYIIYVFIFIPSTISNSNLAEAFEKPAGYIGLIIIILLAIFLNRLTNSFTNKVILRLENWFEGEMKRYRQGQRGEELALNLFNRHFDGHWALFRNIEFPGQGWDIDYVLVGPDGMWIIEVKNFSGTYRNVGDRWEYRLKSYWLPMRKNPSRQARRNAARLSEFLKTRNVTQWANPVIFWVNPTNVPALDTPSVPVWTPATLREEIKRLPSKPIPDEKREQIITILKEVCKPAEDDLYLFDDLE